jgi:hypothetical protein
MQDAGLHLRVGPGGGDRLGQALEPIAHHEAHILHAPVFDLGEHRQPEFRALAAIPGPQPEDVALAIDRDPNDYVHGPVDLWRAKTHHR